MRESNQSGPGPRFQEDFKRSMQKEEEENDEKRYLHTRHKASEEEMKK